MIPLSSTIFHFEMLAPSKPQSQWLVVNIRRRGVKHHRGMLLGPLGNVVSYFSWHGSVKQTIKIEPVQVLLGNESQMLFVNNGRIFKIGFME